jgi:predicted GNAT superfamily acetyltransferase
MKLGYVASIFVLAVAGFAVASVRLPPHVAASRAPQRSAEGDRQALVELENEWLKSEHDAAALERILAPDFVHPVPTGDFLTKAQHIYYSTKYPPPANLKNRFENLSVRVYGDFGIVNGIVVASDEHGQDVDRTIFTDVFAYRGGRWQAVNAQENRVERSPRRPQDE